MTHIVDALTVHIDEQLIIKCAKQYAYSCKTAQLKTTTYRGLISNKTQFEQSL